MGLKSMCTQIKNKLAMYPDTAIIDLIDLCMASGYKGIIWDKLNTVNPKQKNETGTSFINIDF